MDLTSLQHIYEQGGPYATVYLEGRSPDEDARQEVRLRWKALRERLQTEGAMDSALTALESALESSPYGEEQTNGRVLVANSEQVLLHAPWDAAIGAGDSAVWQELPDLGAYLREHSRAVRVLLVVADQLSARIRQEVVAEQHVPREVSEQKAGEQVSRPRGQGEGHRNMVHKPRGQGESQRRIQRRADEAAKAHGKEITERLRKVFSEFQPDVLVLAGEVKGRETVRAELGDELAKILVETDRGGEGPGESDTALTDELLRIAGEASERNSDQISQRWQAALAHELAAQGGSDVAHAAEQGAVETLLLEPHRTATREEFLIKMCAKTDAGIEVVTEDTELNDGIGAILRYRMTS